MSNRDFDEIHDYDYNKGFEETDITHNEISADNNLNKPSVINEPEADNSRSLFSTNGDNNANANVIDNETAMNMIQGSAVNTISIEELRAQQNLPMGLVGGILASILCIAVWSLITVLTKYQITYMAIGVGFAVGFSIQKLGKGITPIYGVIGAILSLLTCFIGNLISSVCLIADEVNISYSEVFSSLDSDTIIMIVKETFQFMDLVFYGIAIYTGYICSIKSDPK
ncbi:hypothetical protein CLV62_11033 [Dysgonomonas alginatilytica]|uniref:Uncharacterized protein n=1 Tax=Dysgonomonas alginatilytica TaxID=1605892 RepID=A0A2V3PNY6_9BACT|nr:hypothetical protein [Dysgonomonas alginatilytica]PXV64390.1 hypothetical protein CLV62_11033 [Dysgonomonas alginatilytica]